MQMMRFLALFCLLFLLPATTSPAMAAARDILQGPVAGEVLEVIDGDTLRVRLHIWIGQHLETLVRIDGIDTPEKRGKCASERAKAEQARLALERILQDGKVTLFDVRHEKYAGRVLAKAADAGGHDIAGQLQAAGLARVYHGGRRLGWCE